MPITQDDSLDTIYQAADEAALLMKTLSNPSRLRILCALVPGPLTVGQLEERLGESQSYVSGQLAKLRKGEMVVGSRDGRTIRYSLSDPRVTPVLEALYSVYCGPKSKG